jgi:hypothetical protein
MRVLFAISILCLCALLWAAVSIARHILATKRRRRRSLRPQESFTEVLFDEKRQQIRDHSAIASAQTLPRTTSAPLPPAPRSIAPAPSVPVTAITGAAIPGADFARRTPPPPENTTRPVETPQPIAETPAAKKAPQPVMFSREHQRLDWDYFNKDLGDLSDPYQPRTGSDSRDGTRRY